MIGWGKKRRAAGRKTISKKQANRFIHEKGRDKARAKAGRFRFLGGILVLAALVFCAAVADWAFRSMTAASLLRIQTVKVSGQHTLSEEEIRTLAHVSPGMNLLRVDLQGMALRVKRHPWIAQVTVRREFPHTLWITVRERVPLAYVHQKDRFYLVDGEGILLGEAQAYRWNLPVVYGVDLQGVHLGEGPPPPALRQAIEVRKELEGVSDLWKSPYVGIEITPKGDAVLHLEETQVQLGRGGYREKMGRFYKILRQVEVEGIPLKEVDLRYGDHVVVRTL